MGDIRPIISGELFAKLPRESNMFLDDITDEHSNKPKMKDATGLYLTTDMSYITNAKHVNFRPHFADDAAPVAPISGEKDEFSGLRISHIILEQYRTCLMESIRFNMMMVT